MKTVIYQRVFEYLPTKREKDRKKRQKRKGGKEGRREEGGEEGETKKKEKRKKEKKKEKEKQTGTPAGYMNSTPKTQGEYPCQSFLRSAFLSVLILHTLLILGSIFILKLVFKKKYEVLLIRRELTG